MPSLYNTCKFYHLECDMNGCYEQKCIHSKRNSLIKTHWYSKIMSCIFGEYKGCLAIQGYERYCPLYENGILKHVDDTK